MSLRVPSSSVPERLSSSGDKRRLIIGKLGGIYEIIRPLRPGGMAEAFVVRRHGIGQSEFTYCLKRTLADSNQQEFLEEAKVASRLRHDAIVRTVDADQDLDGNYFITMELVDGVDLHDLLDFYAVHDRRMPVDVAIFIADEVLSALEYTHNFVDEDAGLHDLVHRDVTTTNILLTIQGRAKLIDFGITKYRGRPRFTRTGGFKGKIPYLAPEHFRRPKDMQLDARVDLFSVGVVLFEMLTGELPFDFSDGEGPLIDAICSGRIKPLLELVPDLDPKIAEIVGRMLRRDREERPDSARTVREWLRPFRTDPFVHEHLAPDVESCWVAGKPPPQGAYDHNVELALQLLEARAPQHLHRRSDDDNEDEPDQSGHALLAPALLSPPTQEHDRLTASGTQMSSRRARRRMTMTGIGLLILTGAGVMFSSLQTPRAPQVETSKAASARQATAAPAPRLEPPKTEARDSSLAAAASAPAESEPARPESATSKQDEGAGSRARSKSTAPRTGRVKIVVIAPRGWAEILATGPRTRVIKRGRSPLLADDLAPGSYVIRGATDESMAQAVQREITVVAGAERVEHRLEAANPFDPGPT